MGLAYPATVADWRRIARKRGPVARGIYAQIGGRSPFLQAVHGQGPENLIGGIADMRITAASQNSLTGELVRAEVQAA